MPTGYCHVVWKRTRRERLRVRAPLRGRVLCSAKAQAVQSAIRARPPQPAIRPESMQNNWSRSQLELRGPRKGLNSCPRSFRG
eukprot:15443753-Alexandrium_andersonii.AAC.1